MANRVRYPHTVLCGFDEVPTFDIRNGPPEAAVSLLIKATVPAAYRWVGIDNMPPARALTYTDAYITAHIDYLHARKPATWSEAQARKAAIALGVSRAVATSYYRLGAADIIPGERATSNLEFVAGTPQDGDVPAVAEGVFHKEGLDADSTARCNTPFVATEDENAVITTLLVATVGTIPLQGFSLINVDHHYLPDPKGISRKSFAAVERQFWKSPAVAEWFNTDLELLQDLLWHKACHPVCMTIKERAACSYTVKEQLLAAKCGSAASRLPAAESEVRAAEAYKALFDTLHPLFAMFGGGINSSIFELAINTVKNLEPGVPAEGVLTVATRDTRIPASVVDRRTAVRWVGQVVARNQSIAAGCYGFYCAMSDQSASLGTTTSVDTLKTAYSLKKLATTCLPSYMFGFMGYGDYVAAKNKQRSKATYFGPIYDCN